MQIKVKYLENLRIQAAFDDYNIIADQPIRYKGDGSAPGPFDYFLASSVMCAAYFVKVYCKARDISTEDITVSQDNILDPENRYNQTFHIQIDLPAYINPKDKKGILTAMERCSVKRVIQNNPKFIIETTNEVEANSNLNFKTEEQSKKKTFIKGKDSSLEDTIQKLTSKLTDIGIKIEIASWRNPVPNVWSVHVRDADSPMCYTNGKGATKDAALCSALGEYFERIGNNYFYNDYYLGEEVSNGDFVHYPNEKWFKSSTKSIPTGCMDSYLEEIYCRDEDFDFNLLVDINSSNIERGVCCLPYEKLSTNETIYIPANIIGNLFVSNGMSAGNSIYEARVQALSEIFERYVKNKIISKELSIPDVPKARLEEFPSILESIKAIEEKGFPVYVKDASLGGMFPVLSVIIMNPKTGGVFASFGSHPTFEIALERTLTELLQGRSFEGLNDIALPTFNSYAINEHNNLVDHFIDSTGIVSWNLFSEKNDYTYSDWNFEGSTLEEFNYLTSILEKLNKEIYIADFNDLGVNACRIIVPNFSEIYPTQDLIWDNNNRAIIFRQDILNIHGLDEKKRLNLLDNLDEYEIDENMEITELIAVAFDENSPWGQLTVGELKTLINLSLDNLELAKESVELFLNFNESLPERKLFYQAVNTIIEIELNEGLDLRSFNEPLKKMYGIKQTKNAIDLVLGKSNFHDLPETNSSFQNLEKHQKLIESYKKLMNVRRKFYS